LDTCLVVKEIEALKVSADEGRLGLVWKDKIDGNPLLTDVF